MRKYQTQATQGNFAGGLLDEENQFDRSDSLLPEVKRLPYKGVPGEIEFDGEGDLKSSTMTIYTFHGVKRDAVAVIK